MCDWCTSPRRGFRGVVNLIISFIHISHALDLIAKCKEYLFFISNVSNFPALPTAEIRNLRQRRHVFCGGTVGRCVEVRSPRERKGGKLEILVEKTVMEVNIITTLMDMYEYMCSDGYEASTFPHFVSTYITTNDSAAMHAEHLSY